MLAAPERGLAPTDEFATRSVSFHTARTAYQLYNLSARLLFCMTTDELEKYGMSRMSDDEIQQLLSTQSIGILGLPTDGAPSMRPLAFWFDGASTLYFLYVLGSSSRKAELSDRASVARFLVNRIETPFNWQSALFTGSIEEVPDDDQAAIQEQMEISWKPELFERAVESEDTTFYQFRIEDKDGIKQLERPF